MIASSRPYPVSTHHPGHPAARPCHRAPRTIGPPPIGSSDRRPTSSWPSRVSFATDSDHLTTSTRRRTKLRRRHDIFWPTRVESNVRIGGKRDMGLQVRLRHSLGEKRYALPARTADRPVTVGRSAQADMQIPSIHAAPVHCVLFVHDGKWVVQDAGGTTGTLVNGR